MVNQELVRAIKKNNALVNSYDDYYFKQDRAKDVLEKHLLQILEELAVEIRMNADSKYKCSWLKDTKRAYKESYK